MYGPNFRKIIAKIALMCKLQRPTIVFKRFLLSAVKILLEQWAIPTNILEELCKKKVGFVLN